HNMAVVAEICDRVGVMYSGSVVEIANTLTIFEEAVHPYTKALIGAIPKKAKRGKLKTIPGIVPDPVNPPTGCRFHPRCKNALEKCSEEKPKLIEIEAGHKVACHLFSP
ncbi:MAG: ABC transporter ATP-binding protein, partial [Candidatus Dadabacteria bacterium]|nr:ABC transporter ATP-binding protein [Candidatus Dadabacteria bacterium]NIU02025.1 ABC transporter ATP-binding protein [Nitrosopumilaceae archaeon]NIU88411.1 ABC transporter ATP-binding protein [Nitrosopumilaceae archaeon]NIV66685.1 ABC transporter ATP-binding protein [Nitrosopumilaceae archaeon]NIX14823.1 ABC transporter ATP-binding protein [Candidatus Dadabacteria bacterium]